MHCIATIMMMASIQSVYSSHTNSRKFCYLIHFCLNLIDAKLMIEFHFICVYILIVLRLFCIQKKCTIKMKKTLRSNHFDALIQYIQEFLLKSSFLKCKSNKTVEQNVSINLVKAHHGIKTHSEDDYSQSFIVPFKPLCLHI